MEIATEPLFRVSNSVVTPPTHPFYLPICPLTLTVSCLKKDCTEGASFHLHIQTELYLNQAVGRSKLRHRVTHQAAGAPFMSQQ